MHSYLFYRFFFVISQCKCTYQKLHRLGKSHSWTYTHNIAHGRKYRRAFVFSPCRTAFGSLDIDFHQIFWMMMLRRSLVLNYLWKFDLIMVWHHWTSIFGRHWDLKKYFKNDIITTFSKFLTYCITVGQKSRPKKTREIK